MQSESDGSEVRLIGPRSKVLPPKENSNDEEYDILMLYNNVMEYATPSNPLNPSLIQCNLS